MVSFAQIAMQNHSAMFHPAQRSIVQESGPFSGWSLRIILGLYYVCMHKDRQA
jgi:hypothetical protein